MYSIYYFCFLITLIFALIFNYYINDDKDVKIPGFKETTSEPTVVSMSQPSIELTTKPSTELTTKPSTEPTSEPTVVST
jgi:hypothetical protein